MIKTSIQIFPVWPGSATNSTTLNVTANGNTNEYYEFGSYERAILTVEVSAVTGTTPTLDLYVEERNLATGSWTQIDKFKQLITTTSTPVRRVLNAAGIPPSYATSGDGSAGDATTGPFGECLRLRWVVGGTSPNFTFTCSATLISPPVTVGT